MRECRIIPKMNKFFVHFNVESTCLCVSPPDGHVFIGIHTCVHDIKSGDFWFWGFGRSWLWAARGSSRFFFFHIKRPTTKTTSNKYCSAKQRQILPSFDCGTMPLQATPRVRSVPPNTCHVVAVPPARSWVYVPIGNRQPCSPCGRHILRSTHCPCRGPTLSPDGQRQGVEY